MERGFASGTPGSVEYQVAAREAADGRFIISGSTFGAIGRFARWNFITVAYLGLRSQSLAHPRLYALAALRGKESIMMNLIRPSCSLSRPHDRLKLIEHQTTAS